MDRRAARVPVTIGMTHRLQPFLLALLSLVASLALTQALLAKSPPKELPLPASIHDLVDDPDHYDGHRVFVTGLVHSIQLERGRRGSEYFVLILEEQAASPDGATLSVVAISETVPKVKEGHRAMVQGVYHREGKSGGRPYQFFIEADAILREDTA